MKFLADTGIAWEIRATLTKCTLQLFRKIISKEN
jgi:hypothetical protein